jgi:hypothetical protein
VLLQLVAQRIAPDPQNARCPGLISTSSLESAYQQHSFVAASVPERHAPGPTALRESEKLVGELPALLRQLVASLQASGTVFPWPSNT